MHKAGHVIMMSYPDVGHKTVAVCASKPMKD